MKVKVVASIGPSTSSEETLASMLSLGVSGFRINFVHGSEADWAAYVRAVRPAEGRVGAPATLIGDLRGRTLRLGDLERKLAVSSSSILKFSLDGGGASIPLDVPTSTLEVVEGGLILMDDGRIKLKVVEVGRRGFEAVALTDATLSSRKGFVIMNKDVDAPAVTEKDVKNLKFARSHGFDYISLSYVMDREDVRG